MLRVDMRALFEYNEAQSERKRQMVQVVGKDPGAVKRVTCKGCASILEYTQSEIQNFTHYDYGGGSDIVYYIICPSCGKQVQNVKRY